MSNAEIQTRRTDQSATAALTALMGVVATLISVLAVLEVYCTLRRSRQAMLSGAAGMHRSSDWRGR